MSFKHLVLPSVQFNIQHSCGEKIVLIPVLEEHGKVDIIRNSNFRRYSPAAFNIVLALETAMNDAL